MLAKLICLLSILICFSLHSFTPHIYPLRLPWEQRETEIEQGGNAESFVVIKKHPPAQALKYISGEHFISISQDVKEMRLPWELLSLSKHLDSFQKGANYRANTQPLAMRRNA